jgi:hypothetical protein
MGTNLSPFISIATQHGQANVESAVAYGDFYGYLVTWRRVPSTSDWNVYGRYVKPGHDSAWGDEFPIDETLYLQKSPAVACGRHGNCLVVEEDNWSLGGPGDYEIRGRLVMAHHVYLPLVVRD